MVCSKERKQRQKEERKMGERKMNSMHRPFQLPTYRSLTVPINVFDFTVCYETVINHELTLPRQL